MPDSHENAEAAHAEAAQAHAAPPGAAPAEAAQAAAAQATEAAQAAAASVDRIDARRTDARTRVTGVIVVGMSVAVWWPAFTIGAWGEPFFDQMLTMWAAATGGLLVVLIQPRGRPRVARALALTVPSLWLALSFLFDNDSDDLGAAIVGLLGVVVALLALPATIWVLARIIWPEFGEDIAWGRRFVIIGAVALIAAASFLLGVNQSKFLTCEEFTISGNSEPPGCVSLTTDVPTAP